jgi:endonuclease I
MASRLKINPGLYLLGEGDLRYFVCIICLLLSCVPLSPQAADNNIQLINQKVFNSVEYSGYYTTLTGVVGHDLHLELHELISNHTVLEYSETWNHLKQMDQSIDDSGKINLFYTGRSHPNTDSDWEGNPIRSNNSWNREHIWPQSHGDFGTDVSKVAGTDLHNLRPTDKSVNYDRGDKDFGYATTQHDECTECNLSFNYWESPNSVKGDIARTLFYMDVRYDGMLDEPELSLFDGYTQTSVGSGKFGKLCTMYQWNVDDPVDNRESERNIAIFDIQNNRNPFIDYPNLVMDIWGEECDTDFDNDGLWGIEDQDDDNDGVNDVNDLCLKTILNISVDNEGCSLNQLDSDDDGYNDDIDDFPNDATQWQDSDDDGCGDNLDGNNSDLFPNDASECIDSDGDGFGDNADLCPGFNDTIDVDSDNISDGCDDFIDSDGDGIIDMNDECDNTPLGIKSQPNGCNRLIQLFRQDNPNGGTKFSFFGLSVMFLLALITTVAIKKIAVKLPLKQNISNKDLLEVSSLSKPELPKHWSVDGLNYRQFSDGKIQKWNQNTEIWE